MNISSPISYGRKVLFLDLSCSLPFNIKIGSNRCMKLLNYGNMYYYHFKLVLRIFLLDIILIFPVVIFEICCLCSLRQVQYGHIAFLTFQNCLCFLSCFGINLILFRSFVCYLVELGINCLKLERSLLLFQIFKHFLIFLFFKFIFHFLLFC